jgi:hypothetical protein
MYYGGARRSRVWCALVLGGTLAIWGALEAALVFALRVRKLRLFHLSLSRAECRGG